MQIHAPAAEVTRLPTPSKISSGHVLENSAHFDSFSHSFLGERLGKGSELHDLCGILVRGNYVTNRRLGLGRYSVDLLPQVPQRDLGS
jgi:hypothetical protein